METIFKHHTDLKISKKELLDLFRFCTPKTNFLFDGKVCDQVDGIAMGSPLAPTLANLFMGHHEKKWIEDFQGERPWPTINIRPHIMHFRRLAFSYTEVIY